MKQKRKSVFREVGEYMGRGRILVPFSLIFSAISTVLIILPVIFIWLVIRDLLGNDLSKHTLVSQTSNIIVIAVGGVLGVIFNILSLSLSHKAQFDAEAGIQKKAFSQILKKPLGYFTKVNSGEVRKIIHEGAESTHQLFAHDLPEMIPTILMPVAIIVIMITVNWKLGLAALVPTFIGFIVMGTMMGTKSKKFMREYLITQDKMAAQTVEYVRGIPVLKVFNQSIHSFKRLFNLINEYHDKVSKYTRTWEIPFSLYLTITEGISFLLVPITYVVMGGNVTVEIIAAFILYMMIGPQLSSYMMQSAKVGQSIQQAKLGMAKINQLLESSDLKYGTQEFTNKDTSIEFKNVSFAYEKDSVLKNITFKVNEGERVAFVGPSGSGKSTIAKLLARFYDSTEGQILIGGKDIREFSEKSIRSNISYVFQNIKLFNKTIRENILMGRNFSDKEIWNALRVASAEEVIKKLPKQLDTEIGKKGVYLSGGEVQRIGLARAMLKNSPIAILDEATAFADPENENYIYKGLSELSKGKTTIYIAHRLNLVKDLDKIFYIENGQIKEQGNHKELCELNGGYKEMYDQYCSSLDWKLEAKND